MKTRNLLLPVLVMAALAFTSCSEKAHLSTYYATIHLEEWTPQPHPDDASIVDYYYATQKAPFITLDVIDEGTVNCYYCANGGLQEPLPFTTYNIDTTTGALWSERLEFDMQPGYITFILKDSDFNTGTSISQLGQVTIKVCVIENY